MTQCQYKPCQTRAREKVYVHGARLESVELCARHATLLLDRGIVHREPQPLVKLVVKAPPPKIQAAVMLEPVVAPAVEEVAVEEVAQVETPAEVIEAPVEPVVAVEPPRALMGRQGVCVIRLCGKLKIQARGLCSSHYNRAIGVLRDKHHGGRSGRAWASAIAEVQWQPPVMARPVMIEPHPEMARIVEAHAARADLAAALGVGGDVALCDLVSMVVMRLSVPSVETPVQGSQGGRYRVRLADGRDLGVVAGRITEDGALVATGGAVYGPRAIASVEMVEQASKRAIRSAK
jgi:hypothetical protein